MIGLLIKFGFIFELTAAVSTAPATGPACPVILLDRFGNTWFQGRNLENQDLVAAIEREKNPGGELIILFEPFSLETDRRQVTGLLQKRFSDLRIKLQPAPSSGRFAKFMFPRHHAGVQAEVLSRRNVMWEEFSRRNHHLTDQVQSYLTALFSQWSKARSDINTLQHEYQQLTTRNSGKTPRP